LTSTVHTNMGMRNIVMAGARNRKMV
jgi:hypothetical protein